MNEIKQFCSFWSERKPFKTTQNNVDQKKVEHFWNILTWFLFVNYTYKILFKIMKILLIITLVIPFITYANHESSDDLTDSILLCDERLLIRFSKDGFGFNYTELTDLKAPKEYGYLLLEGNPFHYILKAQESLYYETNLEKILIGGIIRPTHGKFDQYYFSQASTGWKYSINRQNLTLFNQENNKSIECKKIDNKTGDELLTDYEKEVEEIKRQKSIDNSRLKDSQKI